MSKILSILGSISVAITLAACAASRGAAAPSTESARTIAVSARRFEFEPTLITLKKADSV